MFVSLVHISQVRCGDDRLETSANVGAREDESERGTRLAGSER